jgi:hypothetical protein
MRQSLASAELLRLKAALRDLVTLNGGGNRAAEATGLDASTVSRQCSPEHLDRFMAMDHVALLERDAGKPVVSALMAEMAGARLAPDPVANPHAALSVLSREFGDVASEMAAALGDGRITPNEAAAIDAEAAELIAAAERIRRQCAAIRADVVRRG